jgi:flagellar hook-associated protein 1 FlgK
VSGTALNNSLSGILASRRALGVISNNVSNASNPDYSRQRAVIQSNNPLEIGTLSIGTGASVEQITRARDELLDVRFRQENQSLERFKQLDQVFEQIETLINEPSGEGGGLRSRLSELDSAMQDLVTDPENRGGRTALVGKAQNFASMLRRINSQLQQIGGTGGGTGENSADAQIQATVNEVNNLASEIASLNVEIKSSRASGANPNNLLDQRNGLVKELSKKANIKVSKQDDLYRVNFGGFTLVQGGETHEISFEERNGEKKLIYDNPNQSVVNVTNGKLKALFEVKNQVVPKLVEQLNDMAVQYVDRFNDVHKAGFGRSGQTGNNFFKELPTRDSGIYRLEGSGDPGGGIAAQRAGFIDSPDVRLVGNRDTNDADNDGAVNDTLGAPENFEGDSGIFASSNGSVTSSEDTPIGAPKGTLQINNSVINYDMSEDSIRDVINRINEADNQASAYLSAENRLVIKGTQEANYEVEQLRDTGMLLEKSNILGVGGSDRTGKNDVANAGGDLLSGANFDGDLRLDGQVNQDGSSTSGRAMDLAEGTLEFESSSPNTTANFNVNYDAREDSLEDIVTRINSKANAANSKVAAEVTPDNTLRVFASENTPNASLNPGVSVDPEARFSVDDRASQQIEEASTGTDPLSTVELASTAGFSTGDVVTVSDDTGQSEKAVVRGISGNNMDLHLSENSYNLSDNPTIQGPDAETDITDTVPGGGASVGGDAATTVNVSDASQFQEGEAVIFEDHNTGPEKVIVKSIDETNDTIDVNLNNDFSGGANGVTGNTGSVKRVESNEKRNLLNVLGMDRLYDSDDTTTEFAFSGETRRPPIAEQVAGVEVSEKIVNNPNLVAAAAGDDIDGDGMFESSKGSGNGANMQALSDLKSESIMGQGNKSVDDHVGEMVAELGSDAQLVSNERTASRNLVQNIEDQIQRESGVSLDEELTRMLRQQQAFQANARVISSVRTVTNSVLNII